MSQSHIIMKLCYSSFEQCCSILKFLYLVNCTYGEIVFGFDSWFFVYFMCDTAILIDFSMNMKYYFELNIIVL